MNQYRRDRRYHCRDMKKEVPPVRRALFCIAAALHRLPIRTGLLGVVLISALALPGHGVAQQYETKDELQRLAEQRLGRPVTKAEILAQIRESGLTRGQARARLSQAGYDPNLVDPYYDTIEKGGTAPAGDAPGEFVRQLREVGLASRGQSPGGEKDPGAVDAKAQGPVRGEDSLAPGELPVFGRSLFARATTQFDPVLTGPVDPSYRLGPGDQITLILTGDVESAYTLDVTREGAIAIPDVGLVSVSGITLQQLEDRLYARLGEVYSGVQRGAGATTQFQVSLGRMRSSQVFLVGEVEQPGSFQVSAAATAFNALYQAQGPNRNGSFRRIEVRRGGRTIRTVDLYRYLLQGDNSEDVRLEHGDILFVPLADRQVAIRGSVRRPAIYELRKGETLQDLLRYAGGLQADALVRRVQIDRVLPPEQRRPGVDRVLVDVDARMLLEKDAPPVPVQDGDVIEVFSVSEERSNRLAISGEIRRPGTYQWESGTTLQQLVELAGGFRDEAYTELIHVFRLNREDGSRRLVAATAGAEGGRLSDVMLADRDSVVVYSRAAMRTPAAIEVSGRVHKPGSFPLATGMTLRDAILAAGGFTDGAFVHEAEVTRMLEQGGVGGRVASTLRVQLMDLEARGSEQWTDSATSFLLRHNDRVFIRRIPGYALPQAVTVVGQVERPGAYAIETRRERLSTLVSRAGGVTSEANVEGVRIVRKGVTVATRAERALERPGSSYDLLLEDGDSIYVPSYDPTVLIRGAVGSPIRVAYVPGASLDYYVELAGGYLRNADRRRTYVAYPNGDHRTIHYALFLKSSPPVEPGSEIFVPALPEAAAAQGMTWGEAIARVGGIVGAVATLLIALK